MTKKEKAVQYLNQCHEELYDADQILGQLRITKETADAMSQLASKISEADRLVVSAVDNIS